MTRINVIDPNLLSDKHLGAEYRELPRVFRLVADAVARGEKPDDPRNPKEYVLGPGHVRFFYPRLGYLVSRHYDIVEECERRGRKISFRLVPCHTLQIPRDWFGGWIPTPEAMALNLARIMERGGLRQNISVL